MDLSLPLAAKLLRRYWLPLSLALVGLIFFAYGLIYLLNTASEDSKIKFETSSNTPQEFSQKTITIDIEGEIVNPGVYRLKENSIIQDGLIAAGGLSNNADRDWISKNINLALKLTDGQKIYLPKLGEEKTASTVVNKTVSSGLININIASEKDLDLLPGIGLVTASKIINARPYVTIEDLINKKIISAKVYSQIKDKITAQ